MPHSASQSTPGGGVPAARVAILGAGCAGLALAQRLCVHGFEGEVLLVEARTEAEMAASTQRWCFWGGPPDPALESLVSARWDTWEIRLGSRIARCRNAEWAYQQIRARDYAGVLRSGLVAGRTTLVAGTRVRDCTRSATAWTIETDRGNWTADWVFDARGPAHAPPPTDHMPAFVQGFVGWEIESPGADFAGRSATLMDFQPAAGGAVRFVYLLPYSASVALVEFTEIAPAGGGSSEAELEAALAEWLRTRVPRHIVRERESGRLPMRLSSAIDAQAIGAAGGAIRATSGYGFLASWAQADAAARVLCGLPALPTGPTRLRRWLDGVFLRVLEAEPEKMPQILFRLFQSAPAPIVARFLNGAPRWSDLLRVVVAIPFAPFLRALGRTDSQSARAATLPAA